MRRATAEALSVHPNTLRYRLQRYLEITGQALDSTAAVIELSWAFEARDVTPGLGRAEPGVAPTTREDPLQGPQEPPRRGPSSGR